MTHSDETCTSPRDGYGKYATHCNSLQHTTARPNTLQHAATHCNALQHTSTHCQKLQEIIISHAMETASMQLTATHCKTLQHTATRCNRPSSSDGTGKEIPYVLYSACLNHVYHCNTLQHTTSHCNTLRLVFRMPQSCLSSCIPHVYRLGELHTLNPLRLVGDLAGSRRWYMIPYVYPSYPMSIHHFYRTSFRMSIDTATHCNTLQHTTSHCNTLQHTATHYIIPYVYRLGA